MQGPRGEEHRMKMMIARLRLMASGYRYSEERGAIGALVLGIVVGAALVIFGIIKFLIPGD